MADDPISSQRYRCPRCGAEPDEPCIDILGHPRVPEHLARRRLKTWHINIAATFEIAAPTARTARDHIFHQLGKADLPNLYIATSAGETPVPTE